MKINVLPSNQLSFSSSEFLSAICHELKTPLNAIIAFSETLKEDINNPKLLKDCAGYAQEINDVANDLNDLVHDLLDVGQVASGNFSVDLTQEIDVNDIIKRAVRINYDYSLKRNISIKIDVSQEINPIKLDAKRMKQVLTNLISNAVKYSAAHGQIKISAENTSIVSSNNTSASAIKITICDCGFGMTKEQIQTAFLKYGTVSNPNSNKVDSFGFGLPITKQLVEAQNGKIEIESEVGKGAIIKLIFPYNEICFE
jgi:two-component system cell cycle sensor histidine kinase PleC